jgi:hypothetical protein
MTRALRFRIVVLVVLACVALLASGCRSCTNQHVVAELTKPQGDVKRDTATSQRDWQVAAPGAKLALGDGLKTGPSSDAAVRLMSGGTIALGSDTTLRFLESAPGSSEANLEVETGEATVEADDKAVTIKTTIGLAHIEAGGKMRVSAVEGGGSRVEVTVGAARIDTEDGGVQLSPGRSFQISVGGAIVERETVDASATTARPSVDAAVAEAVDAGAGRVAIDVHGAGVRVQARGTTAWQPLAAGATTVSGGDALEVPNGATVDVTRGARHVRLAGQGRYVLGDEGASMLRANAGRVEIDATSDDVIVDVPGGAIVARTAGADGKSRVDAEIAANGTKISVRQGQGEVRGKGAPETVRAGESAVLTPKGAVTVSGRSPERADFSVKAGDSFTVRDPRPPTAVDFDFSSVCPAAGIVARGDGTTVRGEHRAAMSLPAGHHEYAVRCIGADGVEEKSVATGSVTIVADAARAELPRLPPSTVVDTDGRRYTVLYQNLLPSVIARWPDAAPAPGYVLHVDAQRFKVKTPRESLKPGSVGEGTHVLWFETEDGAKRSADTTLLLRFDNAAPTANVREPADGSFRPGDVVKVSGVVVEGWSVNVYGQAVPLDEQKRFSTTATVPPTDNALVLRMSHAKRGTVYYVRHAAGGTR